MCWLCLSIIWGMASGLIGSRFGRVGSKKGWSEFVGCFGLACGVRCQGKVFCEMLGTVGEPEVKDGLTWRKVSEVNEWLGLLLTRCETRLSLTGFGEKAEPEHHTTYALVGN